MSAAVWFWIMGLMDLDTAASHDAVSGFRWNDPIPLLRRKSSTSTAVGSNFLVSGMEGVLAATTGASWGEAAGWVIDPIGGDGSCIGSGLLCSSGDPASCS